MKITTATALRANVVLFSVSMAMAIVPCLGTALVLGLLDDGMPAFPYQGGTFAVALFIMLLLRRYGQQAFDSAVDAHKVKLNDDPGLGASICSDCPRAWLVQLHLELHGRRCGD